MEKAKIIRIFLVPHVEVRIHVSKKWRKITKNATSQEECIVVKKVAGCIVAKNVAGIM